MTIDAGAPTTTLMRFRSRGKQWSKTGQTVDGLEKLAQSKHSMTQHGRAGGTTLRKQAHDDAMCNAEPTPRQL